MNYRERLNNLYKSFGKPEDLEKAAVLNTLTPESLPDVASNFTSKLAVGHSATHKIGDKYHHVFSHISGRDDPQEYHFLSNSPDPNNHHQFLAEINTLPHDPYELTPRESQHFMKWHDPAQITYSKSREQGKGHGQTLYNSVLAHHGLLMSDEHLSPGSQKQWEQNYPKNPGVNTNLANPDERFERHIVAVKDKDTFHKHIGFVPDIHEQPTLKMAKSESLEKAFQHPDKGWLPESGDPDGLPKKDDDSKVKHSSKVLGPVWRFNDRHTKIRDNDFATHYSNTQRNTDFSTQGKKHLQSLSNHMLKDPDRHVVASGLPNGDQALRLRHLQNAMLGEGGSIKEVHDGIVLTSGERHSKIKRTDNSPDTWHFGEKGLKYLGKTPMSKSNSQESHDGDLVDKDSGRENINNSAPLEKSRGGEGNFELIGFGREPLEQLDSKGQNRADGGRSGMDRPLFAGKPGDSLDGCDNRLGQAKDNGRDGAPDERRQRVQSISVQRQRLSKSKLAKVLVSDNFSQQGKGFVDPSSEHIDTLHQNGHKIHVLNSPDPRHTHYAITASGNPHDTPIAHSTVSTVDEEDNVKEPFISHTYVDKPHREKGLATALKLAIVNHLGSVNSDTRLSPVSHRSWEKLTQNPDLKVKIADEDDPRSEKPRGQHSISLKKPKI